MIGFILALLGSRIPNGPLIALFICPSAYDAITCFFAGLYLNTPRELMRPEESGNLEQMLATGGRRLRFDDRTLGIAIEVMVHVKLMMFIFGLAFGVFFGYVGADRIYGMAPFTGALVILWVILKSDDTVKTIISLAFSGVMVFALIKLGLPNALPVLLLTLSTSPAKEEESVEVDGLTEVLRCKEHAPMDWLLGGMVGLVPGLNASNWVCNFGNSDNRDNRLTALAIGIFAEGIALGVIMASRFTGKTALSQMLSDWQFIPGTTALLLGLIAWMAAAMLYRRWPRLAMAQVPGLGLIGQVGPLALAVVYATANQWALLFPGSGLAAALVIVGGLKMLSVSVPDNIKPVIATLPVLGGG